MSCVSFYSNFKVFSIFFNTLLNPLVNHYFTVICCSDFDINTSLFVKTFKRISIIRKNYISIIFLLLLSIHLRFLFQEPDSIIAILIFSQRFLQNNPLTTNHKMYVEPSTYSTKHSFQSFI